MRKIIKKYLFAVVALLMTASISYASTCANFCMPSDITSADVSSHHSIGMDMETMASNSGSLEDQGTNSCSGKTEEDKEDSSSVASCDDEFVLSSKTIQVKPVVVDLDFATHPLVIESASFNYSDIINTETESLYLNSTPLFIQHRTLLI